MNKRSTRAIDMPQADKRCRECKPAVRLTILPKGWTREHWEWVHAAPDPDRWTDAPTLTAYPTRLVEKIKRDKDGLLTGVELIDGYEEFRGDEAPPTALDDNMKARAERKKARAARNELHAVGQELEDDIILNPANPLRSARALLDAIYTHADGYRELRKLHRHRGVFWQWKGSYYQMVDEETIRSEFWTYLEKAFRRDKKDKILPFQPNRAQVGDAADALNGVTQLDQYIETPAWLIKPVQRKFDRAPKMYGKYIDRFGFYSLDAPLPDEDCNAFYYPSHILPPPDEFLACANGLLHLPTGELYVPTPDYFNISASTVTFDADAPEPRQWLTFLDQVFGNDVEAIQLLQDWFGYLLSPDTSQQKILLMVGPKRCGKGTIGRILTAMLGKESVGAPTMANFSKEFGLESLITKTAAIISDARIGAHTDKSAIVERLLSISGEDALTVPRKFKSAWTGKLPTRFTILTNELPSLTDGSGALAGRFIILIMTKSFFGKEDPALTGKLLTELPGILNWAIEGYRRLQQRGFFLQPKSSEEAVDDIETLASPTLAFVRECCDIGTGLTIAVDDLWEDCKTWSEAQGRKDHGTKAWFSRNLQSAVPGLTVTRPVNQYGNRVPTYVGIGIKPPPAAQQKPQNQKPRYTSEGDTNKSRDAIPRWTMSSGIDGLWHVFDAHANYRCVKSFKTEAEALRYKADRIADDYPAP